MSKLLCTLACSISTYNNKNASFLVLILYNYLFIKTKQQPQQYIYIYLKDSSYSFFRNIFIFTVSIFLSILVSIENLFTVNKYIYWHDVGVSDVVAVSGENTKNHRMERTTVFPILYDML